MLAAVKLPTPPTDYVAILPPLVLMATGLVILLAVAAKRAKSTTPYAVVAALGALLSGVAGGYLWWQTTRSPGGHVRYAFSGMVAADGFSGFVCMLVALTAILAVLLADQYLEREGIDRAEYYVLMLFSASGMQLMGMSNNLIMIFLSIELLSICLYCLAAFNRDNLLSQEAGAKYLLLGAYSSAIMLYGIAMLYGSVGTVNIAGIARFFATTNLQRQGLVLVGMTLVIVGLGFKIAAVPFHMWTPDVYQGAPTPAVGFMASGAKIAGFAGLFRVLETGLVAYKVSWQPLMWGLAILTMVAGAMMAIVQTNIKRALAYSSIANAGFILTGVAAGNAKGVSGALFYLVAYTLMIVGAFAIVEVIARRGERHTSFEDYRGLYNRDPVLAVVFALFMFALGGIPGTAGFVAKFLVFSAAASAGLWVLVVIATVTSVVLLFLYLRIIVLMFLSVPAEDAELPEGKASVPAPAAVALVLTVSLTILLGVLPQGLIDMAGKSTLIFA